MASCVLSDTPQQVNQFLQSIAFRKLFIHQKEEPSIAHSCMDVPETERCSSVLVVCFGVPAVGKSFLVEQLTQAISFQAPKYEALVVSFDTEYESANAGDDFDVSVWHASRKACYERARGYLSRSPTGGYTHRVVFVDDNMYYTSMRRECYRVARDCGSAYVQVHVRCPIETSMQRNAQRTGWRRVHEHVLKRMARVFELPDPETQHWESNTVDVDSGVSDFSDLAQVMEIWGRVEGCWKGPVVGGVTDEQKKVLREEGQDANLKSVVHGVDLRSRKVVNELIGSVAKQIGKGTALVDFTKFVAERRKELLEACRKGGKEGVEHLLEVFEGSCKEVAIELVNRN